VTFVTSIPKTYSYMFLSTANNTTQKEGKMFSTHTTNTQEVYSESHSGVATTGVSIAMIAVAIILMTLVL